MEVQLPLGVYVSSSPSGEIQTVQVYLNNLGGGGVVLGMKVIIE